MTQSVQTMPISQPNQAAAAVVATKMRATAGENAASFSAILAEIAGGEQTNGEVPDDLLAALFLAGFDPAAIVALFAAKDGQQLPKEVAGMLEKLAAERQGIAQQLTGENTLPNRLQELIGLLTSSAQTDAAGQRGHASMAQIKASDLPRQIMQLLQQLASTAGEQELKNVSLDPKELGQLKQQIAQLLQIAANQAGDMPINRAQLDQLRQQSTQLLLALEGATFGRESLAARQQANMTGEWNNSAVKEAQPSGGQPANGGKALAPNGQSAALAMLGARQPFLLVQQIADSGKAANQQLENRLMTAPTVLSGAAKADLTASAGQALTSMAYSAATGSEQPSVEQPGGQSAMQQLSVAAIMTGLGQTAGTASAQSTNAVMHMHSFPQEFTQFVLKSMEITQFPDFTHARLSLIPEHLGKIDVQMTMQNGQIIAQFVAENAHAKDLLESQLPQLRAALQSQGLQVDKLEVSQQNTLASQLDQEQQRRGFFHQRQGQEHRKSAYDADVYLENQPTEWLQADTAHAYAYGNSFNATA